MGPSPSQQDFILPNQTVYTQINDTTTAGSFVPETSNNCQKLYQPCSTPFSAIWSIKMAVSIEPDARSNSCYAYWPEKDSLVIAYGISPNNTYYNDAWFLDLQSMKWTRISSTLLTPRAGARGVLINSTLFIFGG